MSVGVDAVSSPHNLIVAVPAAPQLLTLALTLPYLQVVEARRKRSTVMGFAGEAVDAFHVLILIHIFYESELSPIW